MVVENALRFFGIDGSYTEETLKNRFRELAKEHHPDNGGNAETFRLLKEYYDVLKQYDGSAGKIEDGTCLHDLGKGLPRSVNSVKCDCCAGVGYTKSERQRYTSSPCPVCSGGCGACSGTGKFKLRSGRLVDCKKCRGSGHRGSFNMCYLCYGTGRISSIAPGEIVTDRFRCKKCSGTGEIEIFNPVFPKMRL